MPLARDRGICLRKIDYSETSQILAIFTREHGLIRVIAKGAHRRTKAGASKFDGGVDLLDRGDCVFTHDLARDLQTLTEWGLRDGHLELRDNLRTVYLAQYAAELVTVLLEEHDPHPELFDRLAHTLRQLPTAHGEAAFLLFQLDLLRETGYLPDLAVCAACGHPVGDYGSAYFSPVAAGAVCQNCEGATPDRQPLDARLLRLVHSVLRLPRTNGVAQRLPQLTRHQTDPLNRLLADHIEHTLSRRLRVTRFALAPTAPARPPTAAPV